MNMPKVFYRPYTGLQLIAPRCSQIDLCQNPEIFRTSTIGTKWHFMWPVRVLTRGISHLRKKARILRSQDSGTFFRIQKIPLVSTLTGRKNCRSSCRLGALTDFCIATDRKSLDTLLANLGFLQMEITNLKKCQNPEILRILTHFQICRIPLLSTLTGHVKGHSFLNIKVDFSLGVSYAETPSMAQTYSHDRYSNFNTNLSFDKASSLVRVSSLDGDSNLSKPKLQKSLQPWACLQP
jgi:hypothetical protein